MELHSVVTDGKPRSLWKFFCASRFCGASKIGVEEGEGAKQLLQLLLELPNGGGARASDECATSGRPVKGKGRISEIAAADLQM